MLLKKHLTFSLGHLLPISNLREATKPLQQQPRQHFFNSNQLSSIPAAQRNQEGGPRASTQIVPAIRPRHGQPSD